jgi:hypothetical protein
MIVAWTGYYFKDEGDTPEAQIKLGIERVKRVLSFLDP